MNCGEVKFAEIKMENGRSKGYGTVKFLTPEDARRAVSILDNRSLVEFACFSIWNLVYMLACYLIFAVAEVTVKNLSCRIRTLYFIHRICYSSLLYNEWLVCLCMWTIFDLLVDCSQFSLTECLQTWWTARASTVDRLKCAWTACEAWRQPQCVALLHHRYSFSYTIILITVVFVGSWHSDVIHCCCWDLRWFLDSLCLCTPWNS